jgi:hypothetical protein
MALPYQRCESFAERTVYAERERLASTHALESAQTVADAVDTDFISRQITRLKAAVDPDADLAVSTAKEFVKNVCETISTERRIGCDSAIDFPGWPAVRPRSLNTSDI